MHLTKLEVQGFRSLERVEVNLDRLTMLIGGNDTGKSAILDLLDIVLNNNKPDDNDFHCPPEGQTCDTIEVILEFRLDPNRDTDAREYSMDGSLRIRKVYTPTGAETFYWGEHPVDERLAQDFEKMSAGDQKELIGELDPSALENVTNKSQRATWLREYAAIAPQTQEWIPAPSRWGNFLPRFERYSTMDYNAPENMIRKTLRQVYEGVVYEEKEENGEIIRQPVKALRDIQAEVEAKRRGEELDRGPRIAPISEFIESELARLENKQFEQEYDKPIAPVDEFNDLFRLALDEVWSSS